MADEDERSKRLAIGLEVVAADGGSMGVCVPGRDDDDVRW